MIAPDTRARTLGTRSGSVQLPMERCSRDMLGLPDRLGIARVHLIGNIDGGLISHVAPSTRRRNGWPPSCSTTLGRKLILTGLARIASYAGKKHGCTGLEVGHDAGSAEQRGRFSLITRTPTGWPCSDPCSGAIWSSLITIRPLRAKVYRTAIGAGSLAGIRGAGAAPVLVVREVSRHPVPLNGGAHAFRSGRASRRSASSSGAHADAGGTRRHASHRRVLSSQH